MTNADGPNALYRNNGDGTFTDVAARAGVADPDGVAIGVACADYDNDGRCDLLVTRLDRGLRLYRNKGDGTFADVTKAAGLDLPGGHPARRPGPTTTATGGSTCTSPTGSTRCRRT